MSLLLDIFKSCFHCFYSFKYDNPSDDGPPIETETTENPHDAEHEHSVILEHFHESNDTSPLDYNDGRIEKVNDFNFDSDSDL